jgi:hypothetical protein
VCYRRERGKKSRAAGKTQRARRLDRAQKTLAVWTALVPALKIGTLAAADLATMITGFEPLVRRAPRSRTPPMRRFAMCRDRF